MKRSKICCVCSRRKELSHFPKNKKYKYGVLCKCMRCCYFATIKSRFGITKETYLKILRKQKYVCAICFGKDPLNSKLCVDHDHATGVVRGLLCTRCNLMLGHLDDNKKTLKSALKYLRG